MKTVSAIFQIIGAVLFFAFAFDYTYDKDLFSLLWLGASIHCYFISLISFIQENKKS